MSEREALGSAQALALGGELGDSGQRGAHSRSVTVTDGRKVASEIRYKASDAGDRQYTKSKFTGTSSVRAIALASQHGTSSLRPLGQSLVPVYSSERMSAVPTQHVGPGGHDGRQQDVEGEGWLVAPTALWQPARRAAADRVVSPVVAPGVGGVPPGGEGGEMVNFDNFTPLPENSTVSMVGRPPTPVQHRSREHSASAGDRLSLSPEPYRGLLSPTSPSPAPGTGSSSGGSSSPSRSASPS